ncbi:MAG TPA: cupin domain-containing protein [Chloroflexota bacterium]|nr:cupin domain-containing protein [Chloroflexota bacterium]
MAVETAGTTQPETQEATGSPYERWVASTGVPVYRGYYVEDVRTLELGEWPERQCRARFLMLAGQEGISEARVTEIAPGHTLPPVRMALDEIVYVVQGRGLTTLWGRQDDQRITFEWQDHSVFVIPRTYACQLSSTQGTTPARLLHYNYLPVAMSVMPSADFFFDNGYVDAAVVGGDGASLFSEARVATGPDANGHPFWSGNFFPDMRAWDRLVPYRARGAGGHAVFIEFPRAPITAHMSVFPARSYKKAHRHGPGVVIIIPAGEGYSIMWEEGKEKIVIPWHEGSVFVPPNRWFHQHFNVGGDAARYFAFHSPSGLFPYSEKVEDLARDQIEYCDEDPSIRQRFEIELGKRGLKSIMPDGAYRQRDYQWEYQEG